MQSSAGTLVRSGGCCSRPASGSRRQTPFASFACSKASRLASRSGESGNYLDTMAELAKALVNEVRERGATELAERELARDPDWLKRLLEED
jgi:hypothetical protein